MQGYGFGSQPYQVDQIHCRPFMTANAPSSRENKQRSIAAKKLATAKELYISLVDGQYQKEKIKTDIENFQQTYQTCEMFQKDIEKKYTNTDPVLVDSYYSVYANQLLYGPTIILNVALPKFFFRGTKKKIYSYMEASKKWEERITFTINFLESVIGEKLHTINNAFKIPVVRLMVPETVGIELTKDDIDALFVMVQQYPAEKMQWESNISNAILSIYGTYNPNMEITDMIRSFFQTNSMIWLMVNVIVEVPLAKIADYLEVTRHYQPDRLLVVQPLIILPDVTKLIGGITPDDIVKRIHDTPTIPYDKNDIPTWINMLSHPERGIIPLPSGPEYEKLTEQDKQKLVNRILKKYPTTSEMKTYFSDKNITSLDALLKDVNSKKEGESMLILKTIDSLPSTFVRLIEKSLPYTMGEIEKVEKMVIDVKRIFALERISEIMNKDYGVRPIYAYFKFTVNIKHDAPTTFSARTFADYGQHIAEAFYIKDISQIKNILQTPAMITDLNGNLTYFNIAPGEEKENEDESILTGGARLKRPIMTVETRQGLQADLIPKLIEYYNSDLNLYKQSTSSNITDTFLKYMLIDLVNFNIALIESYLSFIYSKVSVTINTEEGGHSFYIEKTNPTIVTNISNEWNKMFIEKISDYISILLYNMYDAKNQTTYNIIKYFISIILNDWLHSSYKYGSTEQANTFMNVQDSLEMLQTKFKKGHRLTNSKQTIDKQIKLSLEIAMTQEEKKQIFDVIENGDVRGLSMLLFPLHLEEEIQSNLQHIFLKVVLKLDVLFASKSGKDTSNLMVYYVLSSLCCLMVTKVKSYFYTFNEMQDDVSKKKYFIKGGYELLKKLVGMDKNVLILDLFSIDTQKTQIVYDLCQLALNYELIPNGNTKTLFENFQWQWTLSMIIEELILISTEFSSSLNLEEKFEKYVVYNIMGKKMLLDIIAIISGTYTRKPRRTINTNEQTKESIVTLYKPEKSWSICHNLMLIVMQQDKKYASERLAELRNDRSNKDIAITEGNLRDKQNRIAGPISELQLTLLMKLSSEINSLKSVVYFNSKSIGQYVPDFDATEIDKWLAIIIDGFTNGLYKHVTTNSVTFPLELEFEMIKYVQFVSDTSSERLKTPTSIPIYDFSENHKKAHYLLKILMESINASIPNKQTVPLNTPKLQNKMEIYTDFFQVIVKNNKPLAIGSDMMKKVTQLIEKIQPILNEWNFDETESLKNIKLKFQNMEELAHALEKSEATKRCDLYINDKMLSKSLEKTVPYKSMREVIRIKRGLDTINAQSYNIFMLVPTLSTLPVSFTLKEGGPIEKKDGKFTLNGTGVNYTNNDSPYCFFVASGKISVTYYAIRTIYDNVSKGKAYTEFFSLKNIEKVNNGLMSISEIVINESSTEPLHYDEGELVLMEFDVLATFNFKAQDLLTQTVAGTLERLEILQISNETISSSVDTAKSKFIKRFMLAQNIPTKGKNTAQMRKSIIEYYKQREMNRDDIDKKRVSVIELEKSRSKIAINED